ncbi:MAG: serine/threonine protein kinase [Polyangiaceae bacterium]|nr:serine/threonine protein kinase [Polyangiaceae bacterium]
MADGAVTSANVALGAAPASAQGRISGSIGRLLRDTYRIVAPLDEGGMGKVFAAEHVRLHRRVAVKFLARHLAGDHNALARFQREAEIISQLHHPHIVHILDFDATAEGEPYIVMEFLYGESLADRLARGRILPVDAVVRIVSQIASGLQLAHTTGVVHRDLKPANVFLLTMPDNSYFAKLLDFGISKAATGSTRVTREFDVLGTPDYMAPEQARGRTAVVDHRADQFALAAMAYEMISGCPPFQGDSVASLLRAVVNEDPPPLTEVAPLVRPAMTPVVLRALSKDPERRYETIAEFAVALAEAAGAPLSLPPFSKAPLVSARSRSAAPTQRPADAERVVVEVSTGSVASARAGATVRSDAALQLTIAKPTGQIYSVTPGREEESPSEEDPLEAVHRELDRVRRSMAFSESSEAYEAADEAMRLAFTQGTASAKQLVRGSAEVLEAVFERRVRGPKGLILLRHVPGPRDEVVTHNQVYLLTRLEDRSTLDDALDLSPLSRLETLWLLACSLDTGAIEIA